MPEVQKVGVALTSDQLASLKAAIETGEYATTSEIVREALRDWQFKRQLRQEEVRRLRHLWNGGRRAVRPSLSMSSARLPLRKRD